MRWLGDSSVTIGIQAEKSNQGMVRPGRVVEHLNSP